MANHACVLLQVFGVKYNGSSTDPTQQSVSVDDVPSGERSQLDRNQLPTGDSVSSGLEHAADRTRKFRGFRSPRETIRLATLGENG